MRFSDIPLWRRVLIVVVTFAICGAAYWLAAIFFKAIPVWLGGVLVVAMVAFSIIGIRYDNRVRRRLEAEGLLKPRRNR